MSDVRTFSLHVETLLKYINRWNTIMDSSQEQLKLVGCALMLCTMVGFYLGGQIELHFHSEI